MNQSIMKLYSITYKINLQPIRLLLPNADTNAVNKFKKKCHNKQTIQGQAWANLTNPNSERTSHRTRGTV